MAEVNFGLLNTQLPGQIAGISTNASQEGRANAMQMIQLQHGLAQNRLADLTYGEQMRQIEEQKQIRNALAGVDINTPEGQIKAIQNATRINPKMGFELQKTFGEAEKRRVDMAKTKAETDNIAFEQRRKNLEELHQRLRNASTNPTDDTVRAAYSKALELGAPIQEVSRDLARILAMPLDKRAEILSASGAAAADMMKRVEPKIERFTTPGGGIDFMNMNPNRADFGQRPQGVAPMAAQMTPYESARIPLEQQRVGLEGQRVGLEGQRVGLEQRRVNLAEQEATPEARQAKLATTLSAKDLQARESSFPQASLAIKSFEADTDTLVKELEDLKKSKGLPGITGLVYGNTPAITGEARAARALLDSILAKGQFNSLQALRNNSPTGGALGNVSDRENQALRDAFGALNTSQRTEDFQKQIGNVIDRLKAAKTRTKEAYDMTYEYRAGRRQEGGAPKVGEITDGYKFKGGNPADPKNWEKQ